MSSPPNNNQGSPPVVQTILESFTRCFNPLEPCTKVCASDGGGGRASRRGSGAGTGTPTSQLFGLNISPDGYSSRAVSRSHSSADSRNRKMAAAPSYDADGAARAKRSHHQLAVSPEALEEKSMKRKLEIFRGTEEEANCRPRLAPRSRRGSRSPPSSGRSSPRHDLLLSSDEEDLVRTQSRKRFACGMNMERIQHHSPTMSRVANFFTEAQKPFGLCFATPVRTASQEDIANLSDDKLTDDEFRRRHTPGGGGDIDTNAIVTPHLDDAYNEEETITSTLYFDQKLSQMIQTRPPMPLFEENMVDSKEDELTEIIKRRSGDAPPVEMVTSKMRKNLSRGGSSKASGRASPRASPFRVGKGSSSARGGATASPRGSPFRGSPFRDLGKSAKGRASPRGSPRGSPFSEPHKPAPSPVRIHTESMSMGTASVESHEAEVERIEVQKLLEPDFPRATAAEF